MEVAVKISTIHSCRDTWPVTKDLSFDRLAELLTTFRPYPPGGKDTLPAWIPAWFSGKRAKRNVLVVSCFVLDIDDGTTIAQGMSLWPGYCKILHSSWSHRPEAPKFRIVFPLAEEVPQSHWKRTWLHLSTKARLEGIHLDPKCCNPDRIYYLPAVSDCSSQRIGVAMPGEPLSVNWRSLPDVDEIRSAKAKQFYRPVEGQLEWRDPAVRKAFAIRLGYELDDERAFHGTCPSCGRKSVWFFLDPTSRSSAECNHRLTCGWRGGLGGLT